MSITCTMQTLTCTFEALTPQESIFHLCTLNRSLCLHQAPRTIAHKRLHEQPYTFIPVPTLSYSSMLPFDEEV